MKKPYIVTSAFCKWELLEKSLNYFYSIYKHGDFNHVIIDQHYPVNKAINRERIKSLALVHECIFVDSGKDLGAHHGWNNAIRELGITKNDQFIGLDPDDRIQPGAIEAMLKILKEDPKISVAALSFSVIHNNMKNVPITKIAGFNTWMPSNTDMWNIASYNMEFILGIGGFNEPNPYYGGLESYLESQWRRTGFKGITYLKDFVSEYVPLDKTDPIYFDKSYRQYKDAHLRGFKGSFEDWLK